MDSQRLLHPANSVLVNEQPNDRERNKQRLPERFVLRTRLLEIKYNSLLELKYIARTKVVAFADDLIMATRGESVRAVENNVNIELNKINRWSKNNKTKFNDKKSKVIMVSRRKMKENKNITVYLNTNH